MPTLDNILRVFEHNLNKGSVIGLHNRRVEVDSSTSGLALYASNSVNTVDLEVVREFQRSVCRIKRYTVHSVSLLPVDLTSRASESDGSCGVYHTVVV